MTDERKKEQPSDGNDNANVNPIAALRREELKYAHLSRRDSEIRRANREALSKHIAEIQDAVQPVHPSTGSKLEIAERYRRKRPDTGCRDEL
jgi:hypothetical protein